MLRLASFLVFALLLAGCATPDIADYQAEKPKLDLATYFSGRIDGWGMVKDRSGRVTRRFYVAIDAKWTGNTGVLDERFQWSDGKTERRVWTITKNGDQYTGTASDVVGSATGVARGNALRWNYVLALPVEGGSVYHMDMDDWMYLIDEQTLGNQTKMSKWGIQFAEITIFFRKT